VRARIRLLLVLHAAAIATAAGAVLVGAGVPFVASRTLGAREFALLAAATVAAALAVGVLVLVRGVARPLDRLLAAAERLGRGGARELPPLGPPGEARGSGLSRAALAFERLASSLGEERARLDAKVEELAAANRHLEQTREDLLRAERLATVGRLASGIAHEVGNPLGAIAGYADLARTRLRDGRGVAEAIEYLERIGADVARIDAIVRDLLDFARPAPPALTAVDVGAALEAALRLARVQPRFRDVEVELDLGVPLRVLADERRLSQVFLNLLLNAGDAMRGRGRLRVAARSLPGAAPPRVEIQVADEGPGIAPEHLSRVFDPFFTTKEPGQGTGLGLAVCHGLVASFGGTLTAANVPGAGAALTLELRGCEGA
jgi:two-component system NtrC family sensor kinase